MTGDRIELRGLRARGFHGVLDFALAGVDQRTAAGLLIAAGGQRVQRQRVGIGHRAFLFDEDGKRSDFERRQERQWTRGHGEIDGVRFKEV